MCGLCSRRRKLPHVCFLAVSADVLKVRLDTKAPKKFSYIIMLIFAPWNYIMLCCRFQFCSRTSGCNAIGIASVECMHVMKRATELRWCIVWRYSLQVYRECPWLQVIAAEGEQKAARALKDASDVISESSLALQLRYLQTLSTISAEKNSTIIFPMPIEFLNHFMPQRDNWPQRPSTGRDNNNGILRLSVLMCRKAVNQSINQAPGHRIGGIFKTCLPIVSAVTHRRDVRNLYSALIRFIMRRI